jgi:signal transduction histidine kinase
MERNLHDGTQQRLVSLAMLLGLLDAKLPADPGAAKRITSEARQSLAVALEELRELSNGFLPSILAERGLSAAIEELADRAAVTTYVDLSIDACLSPHVEEAAYFVASEALTNAIKHSHARQVRIVAVYERGLFTLEVADDGIGGAVTERGSGLTGLGERLQALGGRLTLSSPRRRGTTVSAEIPCEDRR